MSAPNSPDPNGLASARLPSYSVVITTDGGGSALTALLTALDHAAGPRPDSVVVVDHAATPAGSALEFGRLTLPITVHESGGKGPAAARNAGWQQCGSDWIAFLDEGSEVTHDWPQRLVTDLARCGPSEALSAAVVNGPDRIRWNTADLAVRRSALAELGGFDEHLRHGRDGSDLALRMLDADYRVSDGLRVTGHPGPGDGSGWLAGVRAQLGTPDDAQMSARHGWSWRRNAGVGTGRLAEYAAATASGLGALGLLVARRPRAAAAAAGVWLGFTGRFAVTERRSGPTGSSAIGQAVVDAALAPPVACYARIRDGVGRLIGGRSELPRGSNSPNQADTR